MSWIVKGYMITQGNVWTAAPEKEFDNKDLDKAESYARRFDTYDIWHS